MRSVRGVPLRAALAAPVGVVLGLGATAQADHTYRWRTSGNGPGGGAMSFDGSGYTAITGVGSIVDDAFNNGGVFTGAGFGSNYVNLFMVDLTGSGASALSDLGLVLFGSWGNSDTSSQITIDGLITVGPPLGVYTGSSAASEVGTFGATSFLGGSLASFIEGSEPLPSGFFITNFQNFNPGGLGDLGLDFINLVGVTQWALFSANPGLVISGTDTHGLGENTLILSIPLPAPLGMAVVGLLGVGGLVILRGRSRRTLAEDSLF